MLFSPLTPQDAFKPSKETEEIGLNLIRKEKAACLIFAGGLSTRFNSKKDSLPKGILPLFAGKSLFQIHFEHLKALQEKEKCLIPVTILVSSFNKQATQEYLAEKHFFELSPSQVTFLTQKDLPYLTSEGSPLYTPSGQLINAPNGNGGFYEALFDSTVFEKWRQQGIEFLHLFPIDNPLIDPLDPSLMGILFKEGAEAALKGFKRASPFGRVDREAISAVSDKDCAPAAVQKVGLLVVQEEKILVKDYVDLPPSVLTEKTEEGSLLYPIGNIGHYCFCLSFLHRLFLEKKELPLHLVKKQLSHCGIGPLAVQKQEKFALDLLHFSQKTVLVLYEEELSFAPLKAKTGANGIKATAQAFLQKQMRFP